VVYLCRRAHREQDRLRLEALWGVLLTRIDRFVTRGFKHLRSEQAKGEAAIAIEEALAAGIFDLRTDKADFLQVRFFNGLHRLVTGEFDRRVAAEKVEDVTLSLGSDEEAIERPDELEVQMAVRGRGAAPLDQSLHIQEHLAKIKDPRHREAFVRVNRDGWKVKDVAKHMGVTEKTIFNWNEGAKALLQADRGGPDDEAD
jgi:hypothetical protein